MPADVYIDNCSKVGSDKVHQGGTDKPLWDLSGGRSVFHVQESGEASWRR